MDYQTQEKKAPNIAAGDQYSFLHDFTRYRKYPALCLMLLPVIAYFAIFKYWPMAGILMAFKDFKLNLGVWGSEWVGIRNFVNVFNTSLFTRALANTVIISFLKTLFGFPAPIILALLLNEVRHAKFKSVVQTVSYLPHFLSWVVLTGLFEQLLSPSTGAVNYLLKTYFGMEKSIYFMGDNNYFRGTLVVTDIWKNVGWSSILYLATIAGIDTALYEAAACDGATRLQCTWYITIPSLLPTITIMLILNIGSILDAGFDQVLNMYNSAVLKTGDIIDTYVYRVGLGDMEYSTGTAVGLFKNVIGFVLVIGTNSITRRINGNGIW